VKERDLRSVDRARQHSLGDLTRRTTLRYPDKPAIIDGGTTLTFAQLEAAVDRTAAAIADAGLAKGQAGTAGRRAPGLTL
jgi:fatty-acyl-CoA synthase